jgi:hypothetical protein
MLVAAVEFNKTKPLETMVGENRQLVTDEQVEFEK